MSNQVANIQDNMGIAQSSDGTVTLVPENMTQVIELARLMSKSDLALPKFLRGNQGACMAISMQAYRWGMEPFTVANKAYSVNDRIAYESQLIAAVINTRAKLKYKPIYEYTGDGPLRKCFVTACFEGENIDRIYESPPINTIKPQNSPLWKTDPDQQLGYYSIRSWSRRYQPELLMGIYSIDEFEDSPRGPENARDVTPPRPTQDDFKEPEFILWDNTGVEAGEFENPEEYILALCTLMDDMLKADDAKGFDTIWDNNLSIVDSLDDENQLTARTFFNEMKPKEDLNDSKNVSRETISEPPPDDEEPEEQPEFHVKSSHGDDDICRTIEEWGDAMNQGLSRMKTKDGVKAFKKVNDAELSRLDSVDWR